MKQHMMANSRDTEFSIFFPRNSPELTSNDILNDQRTSFVHGETIDVLVLAKCTKDIKSTATWMKDVRSLGVLVSLTLEKDNNKPNEQTTVDKDPYQQPCIPLSSYSEGEKRQHPWTSLDEKTLACSHKVTLDAATATTAPCTINVVLWIPQVAELQICEANILENLLKQGPSEVLKHQGQSICQIVTEKIIVKPPPLLTCRHVSIGGNQQISIQVKNKQNCTIVIHSLNVQAEANQMFSPSDTSEVQTPQSEDSNYSMDIDRYIIKAERCTASFPMTLKPLEEYCFLFTLEIKQSLLISENVLDVQFLARLKWRRLTFKQNLTTTYQLMSIKLTKSSLLITASSVEQKPTSNKSFSVQYDITNNLQDYMALKLTWNPKKELNSEKAKEDEGYRRSIENVINNVVCEQPTVDLGSCKTGQSISTHVNFLVLKPGFYEVSEHMKLILQYSVANFVPGHKRTGSITSTHSMPSVDTKPEANVSNSSPRSSSMCPLRGEEQDGLRRRNSLNNMRNITPLQTPSGSPAHTPGSPGSQGSLLASTQAAISHQARSKNYPRVQVLQTSMSRAPSGVIAHHQVRKRNCVLYIPENRQTEAPG